MKALDVKSVSIKLKAGCRIVRWTVIGSVLGALSGLVFGLIFAGLAFVLHAGSGNEFQVTGYFAACGALAGILIAACDGSLENDTGLKGADLLPKRLQPEPDPVLAFLRSAPYQSPARNRLEANSGAYRPSPATLASRNPSRN